MSTYEHISITFKFGGYWVLLKNQNRKKYDGGKQKSIRLERDLICIHGLRLEAEAICPWLKGHDFELHYCVYGTSPKEYKLLAGDIDVLDMLGLSQESGRVEVVVVIQGGQEDTMHVQDEDHAERNQALKCYQSSSNICVDGYYSVDAVDDSLFINEVGHQETLKVGACFVDSTTFKHVLRTEAIKNNFGVKIEASNRIRVVAICSYRGCPWRIRAAVCADGQTFEIRKLEATHTCPGVNRAGNNQASSSWVAEQIQEIISREPNITPKQINRNLENMYGLSLPYMKIWRSREQARDKVFGSIDDSFRLIPALKEELSKRNPGSHILFTYNESDFSFKRFFVSFKVCTDGFLAGCRHLIGLDACHLKSKYLGVLLSANCLDGNNGLFTLAFAVAETESKKTWEWFCKNLSEALGQSIEHLAFISDMEKGLGEAIKIIFPNAEHRVCMRHLWKNMKKYFHCKDGHKIRDLVWSAANVYTTQHFHMKMNELLNIYPQVHSYLISLPYKWSRCTFSSEIKSPCNTNNMSESFNLWIRDAREKAIIDLVDMIRGMLMQQRAERKVTALGWRGELVPFAEEYIRTISTRKEHFIIKESTPYKAEIEGLHERHVVDIVCRECTCRYWEISGLPCIHAVAFIIMKGHTLWHRYVDDRYHIIRYRMAYEGPISALLGKDQWNAGDNMIHIGVPNTVRPRGRPRKKRLKNFLESNNKRSNKVHKCSRCGQLSHHKTTCKNPLSHADEENQEV